MFGVIGVGTFSSRRLDYYTNGPNDKKKSRKKKLDGYDEANEKVLCRAFLLTQEGYLCPCPATVRTHSLSPVICNLESHGQGGLKVALSGCGRSLFSEKGRPEIADFCLFWVCFNGRHVGEKL